MSGSNRYIWGNRRERRQPENGKPGGGYGPTIVLNGIDLEVRAGTVMALLGRNGAGKTTLLETIMGTTRRHSGTISYSGNGIHKLPTEQRMRLGLGHVPQGRQIFPSLTVQENLLVGRRPDGWTVEQVYGLFPRLAERRRQGGTSLSGGEQQMLAIGRALCGAPKMLLLDEPTEGLAPVIVDTVLEALCQVRQTNRIAMLLVEHKVQLALSIADDVCVLDREMVTYRATSDEPRKSGTLEAKLVAGSERTAIRVAT